MVVFGFTELLLGFQWFQAYLGGITGFLLFFTGFSLDGAAVTIVVGALARVYRVFFFFTGFHWVGSSRRFFGDLNAPTGPRGLCRRRRRVSLPSVDDDAAVEEGRRWFTAAAGRLTIIRGRSETEKKNKNK